MDKKTRYLKVYHAYRDNEISYEEFKRRLNILDDEFKTKQGNLPLKKREDMMIHFHHKGKRVCSMPTAGLTFQQIAAGRRILAKKLEINTYSLEVKYNKGAL